MACVCQNQSRHSKRCAMPSSFSHVQLFVIPRTVARQAPLSMGFSGKITGVACHALLQGIFPTQGSNPRFLWLPHCRWILYHWATREALINSRTLIFLPFTFDFPVCFCYSSSIPVARFSALFCFFHSLFGLCLLSSSLHKAASPCSG